MIRVGVAGAAGRMGRSVVRAVARRSELALAAGWERPDHPDLGQDLGTLAGEPACDVVLGADPDAGLAACDAVVDFTRPETTRRLAAAASAAGKTLIVGTTGLGSGERDILREAAQNVPVVYATNFSTGVNVLWMLARRAAAALGEGFDAEIVETHHGRKKDAPSGTAMTLLEEVCRGKGLDPEQAARHGREGLVGERSRDEIGLHAVRGGDVVGEHTLLLLGQGERLELKHLAHTRDMFARGAARAAVWAHGRAPGSYSMQDVLGLAEPPGAGATKRGERA